MHQECVVRKSRHLSWGGKLNVWQEIDRLFNMPSQWNRIHGSHVHVHTHPGIHILFLSNLAHFSTLTQAHVYKCANICNVPVSYVLLTHPNDRLTLLIVWQPEFKITRKENCVIIAKKKNKNMLNSLTYAYTDRGSSSTNRDNVTEIGVHDARSACACQRWHHCRWLLRAIMEPQMEHVKVASGGRDGRRLAWLLPLGSLLMGPLVFKCGFSRKNIMNTAVAEITWRLLDIIFAFCTWWFLWKHG